MIGKALIREFKTVAGADSVWTDPADLHTYSYDAAVVDPVRPALVLRPTSTEILGRCVRLCNENGLPLTVRGAGTNLSGGTIPLTREEAMRGGNARIMVPARAVCPACRGRGGVGYYECLRCAGEGVIDGEVPVSISFPPGLTTDHAVVIPLERFGIRNLHLTVLFRPSGNDGL